MTGVPQRVLNDLFSMTLGPAEKKVKIREFNGEYIGQRLRAAARNPHGWYEDKDMDMTNKKRKVVLTMPIVVLGDKYCGEDCPGLDGDGWGMVTCTYFTTTKGMPRVLKHSDEVDCELRCPQCLAAEVKK